MTKRGKRGHVMKAIAVYPAKPHSTHLEDVPMPKVTDIPNGQGVLVKVLRVGVDGTDKEINAAEYGNAPEGGKFLITGHENFGQVMEVGPHVPDTIRPGTYVVATVRRPGHSIYDQIGLQDMTTRSEEHTSELQSLAYLVCRLLLEKKKNVTMETTTSIQ